MNTGGGWQGRLIMTAVGIIAIILAIPYAISMAYFLLAAAGLGWLLYVLLFGVIVGAALLGYRRWREW